jgi:hypothetical protein
MKRYFRVLKPRSYYHNKIGEMLSGYAYEKPDGSCGIAYTLQMARGRQFRFCDYELEEITNYKLTKGRCVEKNNSPQESQPRLI